MRVSLADIWPQLTEHEKWVAKEIAMPHHEEGEPLEKLAEEHNATRKQVNEWLQDLERALWALSNGNPLPELSKDEYETLKASIAERGVLVPIDVDENGRVIDGHNRKTIAKELGIHYETRVHVGLSEEEKRSLSLVLNFARRQLRPAQRRMLIGAELRRNPTRPDLQIATYLGVSDKTVTAVRRNLERRSEIPNVSERTDSLGRVQPSMHRREARERTVTISVNATPAQHVELLAGAEADGKHVSEWLLELGLWARAQQLEAALA